MFTVDRGEWIKIPIHEFDKLPKYSQRLIQQYCVRDLSFYYIEKTGFKKMDLANFVNHSRNPNIASVEGGKYFQAITNISINEELLIDYLTL